ncbi:MAG TPA: prolyl oligopeptidase family serine peptidase, partial [Thermoanaerobaculia bacterium]|nr:prolyl oligopeptidase family serine peptidase [Thermoanaerobaculia bacterium]
AGTSGEGVTRPDAVIDWNGPTDFLEPRELARLLAQKKEQNAPSIAMERLLGGDVEAHRELAQQANPIRYVTRDDPPFLIMHGTADDAVDISQSRALVDALKAAGVDVTFKTYERESHFGIHPLRPVPKRFLEPMLEWLTRHLAMTSTSL